MQLVTFWIFSVLLVLFIWMMIYFFWFNWHHMILWYLSIRTVNFPFKLIIFIFFCFDNSFCHTIYTHCNTRFDFSFLFCSTHFISQEYHLLLVSKIYETVQEFSTFLFFHFFISPKCDLTMNFSSKIFIVNSSSCQRLEANGYAHLIRNKKHNVKQLTFIFNFVLFDTKLIS